MSETKTAGLEGAIGRYPTVGGATVDITYISAKGDLIADCAGCDWWGRRNTDGLITDTPEVEATRVQKWLPAAQALVKGHAEKCRAKPKSEVRR